jgi:hypothetical protein
MAPVEVTTFGGGFACADDSVELVVFRLRLLPDDGQACFFSLPMER